MDQQQSRGRTPRRADLGSDQQLSSKVAAYVREGIMVGQFRAGEYVRTERLADELGVSPTPVREALMLLGSEGSVKWEPRKGYRVVPLTLQDVRDLFQVQAHIAGELAFRAASKLSDEAMNELEELQRLLEKAEEQQDYDLLDALNHKVHSRINKASNSGRLVTLLNTTVGYVPLRYLSAIQGWAEASVHDHQPILVALRNRDADTARKAMHEHIDHVGQLLVEHLVNNQVLAGDAAVHEPA
ncbi:GntR family transcriptional regulator [Arthrobacter sp. EpRS71]|uniref:GntR family transcriptional regulator n=1 Tax=Arthrobacter sp. EpRS71 TaxID=1743141 RepID=UPI0007472CEE|nr:GntR family transcriptional regulator [Arthrobacter sp. EpRS71]KUM42219.1 GntR family transcriptional regulator [Arthrobacter sp. EpRS71]